MALGHYNGQFIPASDPVDLNTSYTAVRQYCIQLMLQNRYQ